MQLVPHDQIALAARDEQLECRLSTRFITCRHSQCYKLLTLDHDRAQFPTLTCRPEANSHNQALLFASTPLHQHPLTVQAVGYCGVLE